MRSYKLAAMAACIAAAQSTAAHADFLFFSTGGARFWTLQINGVDYRAVDQGWITNQGWHITSNDNYAVSVNSGFGYDYNDWGHFDLSNFSGPVNSAALRLNSGGVSAPNGVTFSLFDTSASYAQLDQNRSPGDSGGMQLYADLASGTFYGSRFYTNADAALDRVVTLNGAGRAAIAAAAGRTFSMGGTLVPINLGAVPEPSTWALMILGFGLVGAGMRRKSAVAVRYA